MTNEILFTEQKGTNGNLGVMTLNRPSALNALTLPMIHAMYKQLKIWEADKNIKAIILKAVEGRAFCAGGDIRQTYDNIKAHDPNAPIFFRDEYQLNSYIFHYPKPYISLLDGITMGGGVGISIHGSHRVATEKLMFAMPETGIGFFPDVGGTYFLPRLPNKMGYLLGLAGTRINNSDALAIGIAQHNVLANELPMLIDEIATEKFGISARDSVTQVINRFGAAVADSNLYAQRIDIEKNFSHSSIEKILEVLPASQSEQILKKSPTSLKVTLRALHQGAKLSFDACMQQEYHLACHFLAGHDFAEGIRAVVVDKDQKPDWQPDNLTDVSEDLVNQYFIKTPA